MKKVISLLLTAAILLGCIGAIAEDYAQSLFAGNDNQALYDLFTDECKAQIPFDAFNGIVGDLTGAYGQLLEIGEANTAPYGDQTVTTQLVRFEGQTLLLQIVQNADGKIAGLGFAPYQTPATDETPSVLPEGVTEREITVGEGEFALPGVLTLPTGAENVPAVVLVHGSGANDRNEKVGQTKLFEDIAFYLAQNGIATVRYDKRTLVHGAKMNSETLTIEEETIEDAILAGKLLLDVPEVDASRIFLLGHSLGGMQAPRIAMEADNLFCGMLIVAGTPKTLLEIMIAQNEAVIAALPIESQAASLEMLQKEIARSEAIFAMPVEQMQKATVFMSPAYYFYEMQTVDPIEVIKTLQIPTPILQGGGDFQVTPANGVDAYKEALGEPDYVTYCYYEGLNHLMMASVETMSIRDYDKPMHLDESVAKDMVSFINAH